MSQTPKIEVKKFTHIDRAGNPTKLSNGGYANLYYLGEEWVQKLQEFFSSWGGVAKIKRLDSEVKWLYEHLDLEQIAKNEILEKLKDGGAHNRYWITGNVAGETWNLKSKTLESLVVEGKVAKTKQGRFKLVKQA